MLLLTAPCLRFRSPENNGSIHTRRTICRSPFTQSVAQPIRPTLRSLRLTRISIINFVPGSTLMVKE